MITPEIQLGLQVLASVFSHPLLSACSPLSVIMLSKSSNSHITSSMLYYQHSEAKQITFSITTP